MNKRGGVLFAVVMAVMIFAAGVLFLNFIKPEILVASSAVGLDCSNISISDGTKLACLGVDGTVPYFIVAFISTALGIIFARLNI